MKKIEDKELYKIVGGVKFLGRYVGTAIRRYKTGRLC